MQIYDNDSLENASPEIYNTIRDIAKSKGLSIRDVEAGSKLNFGTIGRWGKIDPSAGKVFKVAKFLDVPMEKLLNPNYTYNCTKTHSDNKYEQKLCEIFNSIDIMQQIDLLKYANSLFEKNGKC